MALELARQISAEEERYRRQNSAHIAYSTLARRRRCAQPTLLTSAADLRAADTARRELEAAEAEFVRSSRLNAQH
jgi:hypothetical protein